MSPTATLFSLDIPKDHEVATSVHAGRRGRTLSTGRNCIHHTGVVNRHVKDPAGTSIARGWGRAHGLAPITLRIACMPTVRNQRLIATSQARKPAAPAAPQPGSRPEEAFLVKCRIRGVPGR